MPIPGTETLLFLDGCDLDEIREVKGNLPYLEGVTTNPSLVAKNPEIKKRLERGMYFDKDSLLDEYRAIAQEIDRIIPGGDISLEVYADRETTTNEMVDMGLEMNEWVKNARIKYPITRAGLEAAEISVEKYDMRANMTLCFTQEQGATVHAATRNSGKADVVISPFVGRLDDKGYNGMHLVNNLIRMYREHESHVKVLTASVRNRDHLMEGIKLGSDIVTCPAKVLKEWYGDGSPLPDDSFDYEPAEFLSIIYEEADLSKWWRRFDFRHELTNTGLQKFADDWNELLEKRVA